ncbi:MAG: trimeric intracellular cation channel family protein [Gemmatimonadota bacterium]
MAESGIELLSVIHLVGVAVFAVSGALAAARKGMDLFGVVVIATVTAIGGGTLRDLLLARHPVFWITDTSHLVVGFTAALLTVAYARRRRPPANALAIADAVGLGFFVVAGAEITLKLGHPGIIVVLMGTMTGVVGGVIRDVLSAEIPFIFRKGEIYATAAIAGASIYILLVWSGGSDLVASAGGIVTIVGLRLAAIKWKFRLPIIHIRPERPAPSDELRDPADS